LALGGDLSDADYIKEAIDAKVYVENFRLIFDNVFFS
jgi:hypothetical protein